MSIDLQEYLIAKRAVDDRAIDRRVWDRFVDELEHRSSARTTDTEPLDVLEIGAGVGAMVERFADWNAFTGHVRYRAVDFDRRNIDAAREHLPEWLETAGYTVSETEAGFHAVSRTGEARLDVELVVADAFEIDATVDVVVAAAVLDIVPLAGALSHVRSLLVDDGLFYAPTTFDGATAFSPAHPFDDRIERSYHRHMDDIRDEPGGSRTGRDLLAGLPTAGFEVVAAGAGDWVVYPQERTYSAAERTFLESLLETIEGALSAYPATELDPDSTGEWLACRRDQLRHGELVLVCHHLDVLATVRDRDESADGQRS